MQQARGRAGLIPGIKQSCRRRGRHCVKRAIAVKSQIWIAISVYVLVAIIKKRLNLSTDLYTILQILNLTLFEKNPLKQLLANSDYKSGECDMDKRLNLFENLTGQ